jgi:UDP-N-acetyl-D-glucosamine/UDP-N-acetyl-D-galactosamine dehydrogenase
MLGITFKENCPDTSEAKSRTCIGIRNTKAIDIYHELVEYGMEVMCTTHACPDSEI